MRIPEFIEWLLRQDQSLEIGVVELNTEYKEYSGREETQINSFCFTVPEEQSNIENGVLILGSVVNPVHRTTDSVKFLEGEVSYCEEMLSLHEGAMTSYQSNEYSRKIEEYKALIKNKNSLK